MRELLRSVWEGWKRLAHWIADKQAILIYTLVYFVIIGPIALAMRPFSDPLRYRRRYNSTFWTERKRGPMTLEEARRQ